MYPYCCCLFLIILYNWFPPFVVVFVVIDFWLLIILYYWFPGIPSVVVTLQNYNSNIGSTVTLGCVVTSNPAHTTVYWQRIDSNGGGSNINMNSGKYSGSTVNNPSLTISSSALSDEGNYRCYATNSIGTGQSQNTYLDVVGSKYFN
jgi:hypothetical protein